MTALLKGKVTGSDWDTFKAQIDGITIQAMRHNGIEVSDNPSDFELVVIAQENQMFAKRHMNEDHKIYIQLLMGDKIICEIEQYGTNKFEVIEGRKRYISEYQIFKVV